LWVIKTWWWSLISKIGSESVELFLFYGGNTSEYDIRVNETFDSQTLEIAQIGLAYLARGNFGL